MIGVHIPPGWEATTLGQLANHWNGRGFKKSEWAEVGRPIIRIQNLTGSGSLFNHFEGEADPRIVVRPGDLLLSWAATLGVFVWNGPEAVLNQHIFKVESFIDKTFHRYLLEWVLVERRKTHGSGMVHITRGQFENTAVAVPHLSEQRQIAAALDKSLSRLDAGLAHLNSAIRNIRLFQDAAVNQAAVEPNRHLPAGWRSIRVDEFADVRTGIQKQPKRQPLSGMARPYLRVGNVLRGSLDLARLEQMELFEGELERYRLVAGDLLVVEGNGSANEVGRGAMWRAEVPECVHQNHLIRVRANSDIVDPRFLELVWNAPYTARRIAALATSTSGLYVLNSRKVQAVTIAVPPLDEQVQLVEETDRLSSAVSELRRSADKSRLHALSLRSAVLMSAFTGRLVPAGAMSESVPMLTGTAS